LIFDVTDRKSAEELQFLAHHDKLTGLPNRQLFEEMLGLSIARAKRTDSTVAVLFMDLDTFKQVDQGGCERAVLFHVVPSNKYSVEDNDKFQAVKKDLAEWKEAHKGKCMLDTHLHYGSPAYNIIEAAREFDATLIMMGNVGKGLLHSMTLGSVSDEVLRKSNVHVMIVPC